MCRKYDRLVRLDKADELGVTQLVCPSETEVSGWRICVEIAEEIKNGPDVFTVQPVGTMVLRSRKSGDSLRLQGGTKSLKKLLIDRKIPAQDRDMVPVLADDAGVLAVGGIGVNLDRVAQQLPAVQVRLMRLK